MTVLASQRRRKPRQGQGCPVSSGRSAPDEPRANAGSLVAGRRNTHDRRVGCEVDAHRRGVEHLRHEADVGDARLIAVAEPAGTRIPRQLRLDALEAGVDPLRRPLAPTASGSSGNSAFT